MNIALHLGPLAIVDTIMLTPSEYVEYASAIARARMGATRIPALYPDEEELDALRQASVLAALKGDVGGVVELRRYRLECTAGEPVPVDLANRTMDYCQPNHEPNLTLADPTLVQAAPRAVQK